MEFPILKQLAEELAPLLAPLIVAELRGSSDGWVSQRDTKLGRNNHIEAVRRIQAEDGDSTRAVSRGKLHLLRKDAYDAEVQRSSRIVAPPVKAAAPDKNDLAARFKRRLGVR